MSWRTVTDEDIKKWFERKLTFDRWPQTASMDSSGLARAGFYYSGATNEVICSSCGTRIARGQESKNSHLMHAKSCPFSARAKAGATSELATPSRNQSAKRSSPTGVDKAKMKDERYRLASFDNWPLSDAVSPKRLAAAGLFYTGTADHTKCAFCYFTFADWRSDEDPLARHRNWCPTCSFVAASTGVAALVGKEGPTPFAGAPSPRCAHDVPTREHMDISARLDSFSNSPFCHNRPAPEELASAGFHFIGDAEYDAVKCSECGLIVSDWSADHDPWVQHERFAPECVYLRMHRKSADIAASAAAQQYPAPRHAAKVEWEVDGQTAAKVPPMTNEFGAIDERLLRALCYRRTSPTDGCGGHRVHFSGGGGLGAATAETPKASARRSPVDADPSPNDADVLGGSPILRSAQPVSTPSPSVPQRSSARDVRCLVCRGRDVERASLPCCHLTSCDRCGACPPSTCPVCGTAVLGTYRALLPRSIE